MSSQSSQSLNFRPLYIVAYDIRDRKRLAKVYRTVKKQAVSLQYSIFLIDNKAQASDLYQKLSALITAEDDLRLYKIKNRQALWQFGDRTLEHNPSSSTNKNNNGRWFKGLLSFIAMGK